MIVDAHVHVFSGEVRARPELYYARDAYFGELYSPGKVRLASPEELIADMDAHGVDVAVAVGWGWRDLALCRDENDYLLDAIRRCPGRLHGVAAFAPLAGEAAAAEVERCLALGLRGAGELMPDGQGLDLDRPAVLGPVVEVLVQHDLPLVLHTSEPVGHLYPGKGTVTPPRVLRLVAEFPRLRVVLAHWGGGLPFYELMPEVAAALAGAVYDSAASAYLYDWSVFVHVPRLVGAGRVLFATDYPLSRPARYLRRLRQLPLDPADLAAILGGNASRVFRLNPAPTA